MKVKLLVMLLVFALGFVLGFVPQYREATQLREDLRKSTERIAELERTSELWQLRDRAALMFAEACRKNFGIAGEHSTRFFDSNQSLLSRTTDAELRKKLEEARAMRDTITARLATGDPAALTDVQRVVDLVHQEPMAPPPQAPTSPSSN